MGKTFQKARKKSLSPKKREWELDDEEYSRREIREVKGTRKNRRENKEDQND